MLTGDFLNVLYEISQEYKTYNIVSVLAEARQLLAQRGAITDQAYSARAVQIIDRAKQFASRDVLSVFPSDVRELFLESDISPFLPNAIGKLLLSAVKSNQLASMPSTELQTYENGVAVVISQINGVFQLTNRLNIEKYKIPKGKVGIRVQIPRSNFENNLKLLAGRLELINEFFCVISEYRTGRVDQVELLSLATSEFAAVLISNIDTALNVIQFYNALLDAAKESMKLRQLFRAFQQSPIAKNKAKENQEFVAQAIENIFGTAIEKALSSTSSKASGDRANELKNAAKHTSLRLEAEIEKGLRISLVIETETTLAEIASSQNIPEAELQKAIEKQVVAEVDVDLLCRDADPVLLEAPDGNYVDKDSNDIV